jgi:5-hydroxyisourate hydrolase
MSSVSTHVLDTTSGRPAAGIGVRLETLDGCVLGVGVTDADGRLADLGPARLEVGNYLLRFDTATRDDSFYPEILVAFTVSEADQHYHVPLLLSPYGYTTYRGS